MCVWQVYICGGYNGTVCQQSAECYDPQTDLWTLITPMGVPRSGVEVVTYDDQVYAVRCHGKTPHLTFTLHASVDGSH